MNAWDELEAMLRNDPNDIGCDETFEQLDVYVEAILAGEDAPGRYGGVAAHLAECEGCSEDLEGLLLTASA